MTAAQLLGTSNVIDYRGLFFSVLSFAAIAVTCMVLFILLHMPRCCFGWFREPDWDSYGQAKPESEPEEDQLHRTIV